jgi:tRNA threonylcarbamoyladenosine biosynthesis protein TsaE
MAPEDEPPVRSLISRSAEATEALGERLGGLLPEAGAVVALDGELGTGKTCLVRGLARSRGVEQGVASPSYTLMHEYEGRTRVLHLDAWMEGRGKAFLQDGGAEWLFTGGLVVVEWAERVRDWLPDSRLDVRLSHLGGPSEDSRRLDLRVRGAGPWALSLRSRLASMDLPEGLEEAG